MINISKANLQYNSLFAVNKSYSYIEQNEHSENKNYYGQGQDTEGKKWNIRKVNIGSLRHNLQPKKKKLWNYPFYVPNNFC